MLEALLGAINKVTCLLLQIKYPIRTCETTEEETFPGKFLFLQTVMDF